MVEWVALLEKEEKDITSPSPSEDSIGSDCTRQSNKKGLKVVYPISVFVMEI